MTTEQNKWENDLKTIKLVMSNCGETLWKLRPMMQKWTNWSQMMTAMDIIKYICYTLDTLEESINTEDE